jgi:hypothetical protein
LDLAEEAASAVQHFGVSDLANAQLIVATPQMYNDAGFNQTSYCAWHDYTTPVSYPGVTPGMAFTNMPYVLNAGGRLRQGLCQPRAGTDKDGVTIVLGHDCRDAD